MRPQGFGLILATLWWVSALGCSSGRKASASEDRPAVVESAVEEVAVSDAVAAPSKAQATYVVQRFATALLANDLDTARAEMRIPESLSDKQVAFFLRELGNGEHLCAEGLAGVLAKELGPLAERFGDKAGGVAEGAQLRLDEAYALGDTESAVLLYWDGTRFWIAALLGLGPEG